MAIKPILFNTEMVRAILDGWKTCTRRIVKSTPSFFEVNEKPVYLYDTEPSMGKIYPPCQPGDILYVRETWQYLYELDGNEQIIEGTGKYYYAATDTIPFDTYVDASGVTHERVPWKPSIHMPKEAARIWLKVTDVRVERLQDITEDGAKAEGMPDSFDYPVDKAYCPLCKGEGIIGTVDVHSLGHMDVDCPYCDSYRKRFENLWNSINQKCLDCYGWNANPWVWVIEFEPCEKPEGV